MDREYRSLFDRHNSLAEACTPFLEAMEICGQAVMEFILGVLPKEEGRNADSGIKATENAPKQTPKDKRPRKYEITISKADAPNSKYTHKTGYGLMIYGPIGSRESSREFIFLTKDELVCLAKAVKTMNSERICFCDKVRREYLSGIACDGISTARIFLHVEFLNYRPN